jgi:hypothetical protein
MICTFTQYEDEQIQEGGIWAGHMAHMRYKRNACRVTMEKPEGKKPL